MVDAHAVRSILLQEVTGIRDGLFFPAAVRMATDPWLGPCLSRFTWLAEAFTAWAALMSILTALLAIAGSRISAGGLAGLRTVNTMLMPPALVACSALQLGILVTCRIGFYPVAMIVLHLAAFLASVELQATLERLHGARNAMPRGERGEKHSATRNRVLVGAVYERLLASVLLVSQLVLFALPFLLPRQEAALTTRRVPLHEHWNMYPYRQEAPLTDGRVIAYATTSDGQELDAAEMRRPEGWCRLEITTPVSTTHPLQPPPELCCRMNH